MEMELFIDFLRPIAMGTGTVLAVIFLVGLRMPRRAKVDSRPPRAN